MGWKRLKITEVNYKICVHMQLCYVTYSFKLSVNVNSSVLSLKGVRKNQGYWFDLKLPHPFSVWGLIESLIHYFSTCLRILITSMLYFAWVLSCLVWHWGNRSSRSKEGEKRERMELLEELRRATYQDPSFPSHYCLLYAWIWTLGLQRKEILQSVFISLTWAGHLLWAS